MAIFPKYSKPQKYQFGNSLAPGTKQKPIGQTEVDYSKKEDVSKPLVQGVGAAFGPYGTLITTAALAGSDQANKANAANRDEFGISKNKDQDYATAMVSAMLHPSQALNAFSDKRLSTQDKLGVLFTGGLAYGVLKADANDADGRARRDAFYKNQTQQFIAQGNTNASNVIGQAQAQKDLIPLNYKMYSARKGGIFPRFKHGGVTPHAVIPSGPLHSEKNNMGTKGLPVVHSETNEKKAEVEREEIIFTKPQSEVLEKYHNELGSNPSDEGYVRFGKRISNFINGAKDMNNE